MESPTPLISIITPTFNAGRHIRSCISSIQSQDFGNYEHMIIDGLSTDNTREIVEACSKSDGRIRFASEKDKGIYDAMNKGIRLARSPWIYFLGADDRLYEAGTLAQLAEVLAKTRASFVYGNVFFESLDRVYDGAFSPVKILQRNISHQGIVYRADLFEKMGAYDLAYPVEADYAFNLRCWLGGKLVCQYIPQIIARFSGRGISAAGRDAALVRDFPQIALQATCQGDRPWFSQLHILAAIYRKMLIRKEYSLKQLAQAIGSGEALGLRILALLWMIVSLPFYFLNSLIKPK